MRLTLHTVICCCVFTAVLLQVRGAAGDFNSSLKRRFRVWLQGHMKRDAAGDGGPQQEENAHPVSLPSSFGLNSRPRRSAAAKSSGCVLFTCSYHDLLHKLHNIHIHDKKDPYAPKGKISSNGYGRRRRSLLDVGQLAMERDPQRRSTEAASKSELDTWDRKQNVKTFSDTS